jgi:hypothetical protein
MPYIANEYNPDDSNNTNVSGGTGTTTPSNGGAPSGSADSSSSAYQSGGASGGAARANPSGTPNVQEYLNANQGAGQRLTSGITSNVQNQANQFNQNVNTASNQLNTTDQNLNSQLGQGQATAQTAFQDPQALLAAYQAAQASSNTANPTQTPSTSYGTSGTAYTYNPTTGQWQAPSSSSSTTSTPTNTDFSTAFSTPLSQQQALTDYNNLQANVAGTGAYNTQQQQINQFGTTGQQDVNQYQTQLANLAQTTGSAANAMGQNQLLSNTVGNPNYSSGQQALDSLFLQGQGNQLQQNLGNIYNQANTGVQNLNTNTQAQLQALQQLSAGNVQGTQNLFNTGSWSGQAPTTTSSTANQGLSGISANVANEYAQDQAAQTNYQNVVQPAIASGNIDKSVAAQLGIPIGQSMWGVNSTANGGAGLNSFITNNALSSTGAAGTAANAQGNLQAATPQEIARYQALNQIAGGPAGSMQAGIFGSNPTIPTSQYTPFTFNNAGYNTAVSNAQNTINGEFNTYLNPVLQATGGNTINGTNGGIGAPAVNMNPQAQQVYNQLSAGINNGTLTPQQAQSIIAPYMQNIAQNENPQYLAQSEAPYNQFENYYENTYLPASNDIAGGTTHG